MFCQSGYVGVHISAGHKKGHIWGPRKSGGAQIKGDGHRNKSQRTGSCQAGKKHTGSCRENKSWGHVRQKLFHGVTSGKNFFTGSCQAKKTHGVMSGKNFSMQLNDFASNRPKVEKWSGKKICQILSGGRIN